MERADTSRVLPHFFLSVDFQRAWQKHTALDGSIFGDNLRSQDEGQFFLLMYIRRPKGL